MHIIKNTLDLGVLYLFTSNSYLFIYIDEENRFDMDNI